MQIGDKVKIKEGSEYYFQAPGQVGEISGLDGSHFVVTFESGYRNVYLERSLEMAEVEPEVSTVAQKVEFESVVLPEDIKDQVKIAISQEDNLDTIFNQWGFGEVFEKGTAITLLFHGIPGTGKTLMAQAIADHLDYGLKVIGTADLETSEPGGTERNIRKLFEEAKKLLGVKKQKQVILFDECDSLLSDRNSVGTIMSAQINTLLTEIEKHEGIVILTTNRLGRLDPALERRISAKIEFPFPDEEAREGIWRRMFPEKAPLASDVDFKALAKYPLTGGAIKNSVLNAARGAAYRQQTEIMMSDIEESVKNEIQSSQEFTEAYSQVNARVGTKPIRERIIGGIKKTRG